LDGKGINALLTDPQSLAIFNNTIFLAESYHQIRTITLSGDVRKYAGKRSEPVYVNGNLIAARFNWINGITFDKYSFYKVYSVITCQ
jgi:hypothetical protein